MIYNQSIEKIHLFYRKSLDDFEQAKTKVMNLICILTNVDKLKTITLIQLQESDSSMKIKHPVHFELLLLMDILFHLIIVDYMLHKKSL